MTTVFLVLAHTGPDQFKRLVSTLKDAGPVIAHIDAKADLEAFKGRESNHVRFTDIREDIRWGRWQQVAADLHLLNLGLKALDRDTGHLVLISGDTFPLVEPTQIARYFAAHSGTQFVNVARMPAPHLHKPMNHLRRRFIVDYDHRNGRANLLPKVANNIIPLNYKRGLNGLQPYCGSAWWSFTEEASSWMVNYSESHPDLTEYFSKTRCADEKFFQTLIMSSPYSAVRRGAPMYADFSRPYGPQPADADDKMIDELASSSLNLSHPGYGSAFKLFARKFARDAPRLCDRVEQELYPHSADLVDAQLRREREEAP